MKEQITNEEYVKKAGNLSRAQAEYIFSRLRPKIGRGFEDDECLPVEEIALQLQLEDEALIEWRQRFAEVKEKAGKQH
jgi:hypothetical protein